MSKYPLAIEATKHLYSDDYTVYVGRLFEYVVKETNASLVSVTGGWEFMAEQLLQIINSHLD